MQQGVANSLSGPDAPVSGRQAATATPGASGATAGLGATATFVPAGTPTAATIDANELVLPLISTTLGVGKGATGCNPERTQVTVETWTPGLARNTRGETEVVGMTANRAFYLAVN